MTSTTPSRLRGVVIPAEHGGWGITLEPVVLGLAVAPSTAGFAIGLAALGVFLFRTPFKIVAGDFRRGRRLPRTSLALRGVVGFGLVLIAAVAVAILTADHPFWIPLAAAVPLLLVQAGYDVRNRSRRLLPEVAGPVGMGSVAAVIGLAGGESMKVALGLWLVLALRSIASVVLVRAQLRRAKQQPYRVELVHGVDLAVAATAVCAAAFEVIPWLGAAAVVFLGPFGWWSLWRPAVRAVIVGTHQTVLGAFVVALTAIGVHSGI